MSIKRRLKNLEAAAKGRDEEDLQLYIYDPNGTRPRDVMYHAHFKFIERLRAAEEGRELPPYTQEELQLLYKEDLEEASEGGLVSQLRADHGWQAKGDQELLDWWLESARERVELVKSGTPLEEVYDDA